jgi:hypothetical protein
MNLWVIIADSLHTPGMNRLLALNLQLEYYKKLPIQHLLDPMHIMNNVCHSLLLHLQGAKYIDSRRDDLEVSNTKHMLWQSTEHGVAPYVMFKVDQNVFFHTMQSLRTPIGFGASLKNSLSRKDIFSSLKSYDYGNLIRFMLPIAIRGFVIEGVRQAVFRLARLFHWVCSKNVDVRDLDLMKIKSAIVMSLLEMQLPTSFFDSQIHLIAHLVEEVAIGGSISYHWMFPIKRYLKTLKGFVRQNSQLEGSMGEGYLVQEAMGVCHDIIGDMDKYAPRVWKEEEEERKTGLDYCF